jgi:hypothetical protein
MRKQIYELALKIFNEQLISKTKAAQKACEILKVEYDDAVRRGVSDFISSNWKSPDPGIVEASESVEVDYENVPHLWLKTKNASLFVKNPFHNNKTIDFESVISECISSYQEVPKIGIPKCDTFDRLIWTDAHIGMDSYGHGISLYSMEWNEDTLVSRIDVMVNFVLDNKSSDILIIDELGDFMDGWNGETTRGGHKLPQNMSNQEAFDVGLKAKIRVVDALSHHYKHITCNNICNDNHAGSFAYVVNSAFKSVVDCKFNNVLVNNYNKFISHYIMGDHCFIITHGKDDKNLKFGFKPMLDPRTSEKISQYIRHNDLLSQSKYIEFSKGDSHQCLFDMCTSDEFDYFNFPAFSPSSQWVQTNFKKGRSGFVMQNVEMHSDRKNIKPFFFN